MSTARPRRWAVSAVNTATLLLPPGAIRRRYRHELVSELWGMSGRQQAAHAASLLVAAPSLHRALVESGELDVPHSPLWCRLHLHHRWHTVLTDDGQRFHRCLACGMDDDETSRRRVAGSLGIAHGTTIG